jgi:hypothetical protein
MQRELTCTKSTPRAEREIARKTAMKLLLYFVSFASVFALFASVIAGTLWVLTKFIQAWGRFFRALIVPPDNPKHRRHVPVDLQPHHLKRADQ